MSLDRPFPVIVFRFDATLHIGSGHAMRCVAMAQAVEDLGGKALFVVSCAESASFLSLLGRNGEVLEGDPMALGETDGTKLSEFCEKIQADALLIDTYAITAAFFRRLYNVRAKGVRIAYLDDLYTFSHRNLTAPLRLPVDIVLNYALYADNVKYQHVYAGTKTKFLLGPAFAPFRREFWHARSKTIRSSVLDVLVTVGSTNPGRILERLSRLALNAFPGAVVHVVVGARAEFIEDITGFDVLGPQQSLLPLMEKCDVCISAAGTTLYELLALGVPTIAVAITDNQEQNMKAFVKRELGIGLMSDDVDKTVAANIHNFYGSLEQRKILSQKMQATVSSDGAKRIAFALISLLRPK